MWILKMIQLVIVLRILQDGESSNAPLTHLQLLWIPHPMYSSMVFERTKDLSTFINCWSSEMRSCQRRWEPFTQFNIIPLVEIWFCFTRTPDLKPLKLQEKKFGFESWTCYIYYKGYLSCGGKPWSPRDFPLFAGQEVMSMHSSESCMSCNRVVTKAFSAILVRLSLYSLGKSLNRLPLRIFCDREKYKGCIVIQSMYNLRPQTWSDTENK